MRAGKNRSDVEAELESKEPTEIGDDMISSKDERGQEVVATLMELCELVAASTGGEWEEERHGDIPASRKHAASSDAVCEREAKRTRSPRALEASPALSPPGSSAAEQAT